MQVVEREANNNWISQVSEESWAGVPRKTGACAAWSVRTAVKDVPPAEAVIIALSGDETDPAETENATLAKPPGIVTKDGTLSAGVFVERAINTLSGAGPLRVAVQVVEAPEGRFVTAHCSVERPLAGAGPPGDGPPGAAPPRDNVTVCELPLNEAVKVAVWPDGIMAAASAMTPADVRPSGTLT